MSGPNGAEHAEHTDPDPPLTRSERVERWAEIILVVMLGAAALATAWSGYQSARWGGE